MKKVFLFAALLSSTISFGQRFQLGIKGGVNISNFTGGNFEDLDKSSRVGFHAGGFINFKLGDNFSIQPEVLFSSQGAKLTDVDDEEYDVKLSYVTIPIMAKYRFDGGFYLEAGPQFGFKVTEDFGDNSAEDLAKSSEVSIAAGLGFHSAMGLGIGARYIAGMSSVGDFDASAGIDPDFKNSVIQISLFYTLFNNKAK